MKKISTLIVALMTTLSAFAANRYWIGASGGAFSTTSNWSATSGGASCGCTPGASDIAIVETSTIIQITAAQASLGGLSISAGATVELQTPSSTTYIIGATISPVITVPATAVLKLNSAATGVGTGGVTLKTGAGSTVAGTLECVSGSGSKIDHVGGAGGIFTVTGTVKIGTVYKTSLYADAGNVTLSSGTFAFGVNSIFEQARSVGGTIPSATWDVTSTIKVTGCQSSAGIFSVALSWSGSAMNIGKFEWNCPNQGGAASLALGTSNPSKFSGDFTITNSNGKAVVMSTSSITSSATAPYFKGNINVASGSVFQMAGPGSSVTMSLFFEKDFICAGSFGIDATTNTSGTTNIIRAQGTTAQNISLAGVVTAGAKISLVAGSSTFTNVALTLGSDISVLKGVTCAGNSKIYTNGKTLSISGSMTASATSGWVVTDGGGKMSIAGIGYEDGVSNFNGKGFYIGKSATSYDPTYIFTTNSGATGDYSVNSKARTTAVGSSALVSPTEWDVNVTNVVGAVGTKLEFGSNTTFPTMASPKIGHYEGGAWTIISTVAGAGFTGATSYVTSTAVNSFSPFIVGNQCGILPIPSFTSVTSNTPSCGASLDLTAVATGGGGSNTYNWTGPNSFTNTMTATPSIANASGLATGTYNVTVTDVNTCTATGSVLATVNVTNNPAIGTGNWSAGGVWSCGTAPVSTTDVTIPTGVVITLDVANPTINSLTFTGGGKLQLGANSLTVDNSITGDATVGYVITDGAGQLKSPISAMGTKTFPIGGSNSTYSPVTATPTSATTFGASVSNTINPAHVLTPAAIAVAGSREWDLSSTTPSATVLALTPNDGRAVPGGAIKLGHWNGTAWDADIAATYSGGTFTGTGSSFSPYIASEALAPLTAEFTNITAQAKGTMNVINFATATEKDVKEFAIERSINNKTWEVIGTKAAIGGVNAANYSFNDVNPTTLSYYRVRSIETNGKDQISKIVAVKRNGGKLAVNMVSPVPTTEGVNVDFSTSKIGTLNVVISDIVGKVVKTERFTTVEGNNLMRLNLSNLAQGTYILSLNDGETIATQRIVKQ